MRTTLTRFPKATAIRKRLPYEWPDACSCGKTGVREAFKEKHDTAMINITAKTKRPQSAAPKMRLELPQQYKVDNSWNFVVKLSRDGYAFGRPWVDTEAQKSTKFRYMSKKEAAAAGKDDDDVSQPP